MLAESRQGAWPSGHGLLATLGFDLEKPVERLALLALERTPGPVQQWGCGSGDRADSQRAEKFSSTLDWKRPACV